MPENLPISGPLPPHSDDAEQALIGSLLQENRVYDLVADVLRPQDFYRGDLRRIYETIVDIINQGNPADPLTVYEDLKGRSLAQEGTLSFLFTLSDNVPLASNARRYAQIIHEKAILRDLVFAGNQIAESAFDTKGRPTEEILDEAEKSIFKIAEGNERVDEGLKPIKESLISVSEQVEKLYSSKSRSVVTGVPTGFADLDKLTKGMHPGELIVVAGRPSMGKTTFAMNIAEHVALNAGLPVAIFSMEMPAEQLAVRLISSLKRIPLSNLRDGQLKGDEMQRMAQAVREIADSRNIFIDESVGLKISDIRSRARRLAREVKHLGLIVVDYIQLMDGESKSDNRAMEISDISRGLKLLAKELKCPVIVLSQLNREVDKRPDKRPLMSDLRESGAIEQDADVIIFLYREVVYNDSIKGSEREREAEAILRKQRNGPIGTVPLVFFGEYTHFKNGQSAL